MRNVVCVFSFKDLNAHLQETEEMISTIYDDASLKKVRWNQTCFPNCSMADVCISHLRYALEFTMSVKSKTSLNRRHSLSNNSISLKFVSPSADFNDLRRAPTIATAHTLCASSGGPRKVGFLNGGVC